MKTFEELKEELLTRAKNAGACQSGYAMGLRSNTKADLLKAVREAKCAPLSFNLVRAG